MKIVEFLDLEKKNKNVNCFRTKAQQMPISLMKRFQTMMKIEKVDIAIIEVGLGGRLDSTNIITPLISVITNIGKDHVQFLGNTLTAIAIEKAGIIKKNIQYSKF